MADAGDGPEADERGTFVPFGTTNVPSPPASTPWSMDPVEAKDLADPPDGPPSTPTVRKSRRPGRPAPEVEDLTWVAVYASDRGQALACGEALEHRGIRAVVRSDFDRRHGFARGRQTPVDYEVVEVLVPEAEAELALTVVEGPIADELEELNAQTSFGPQPDDDYFLLRSRMDVEMPHAGRRAKDRAARRALAELDGRSASERPDQPPSEGCRRQMLIALVVLLAAMVVLVVLWLATGHGLTDPGCQPAVPGQPIGSRCS